MKRIPSFTLAALLLAAPLSAATLTVNAGGNLKDAIQKAAPGDEIVVQAGARFVGPFALPVKPFGAVITIRSSATLPDRQINPADAALLPTLGTTPGSEVLTGTNVANWKLDGLAFEATTQAGIIEFQNCTAVTLDRLLINVNGQRRGVLGNCQGAFTLTRSYIAGIFDPNSDSQAFAAWDGAGPYTITDNHLEAASENILFGGEDSASEARIPSNILIARNTVTKPLAWKGTGKNVKNLLELKSARHVVIRQNLFEHNWVEGQAGSAIVFTPRNQYGNAPWSIVEDVLFEQNIVRDSPSIFNILGYDNEQVSKQTTGIVIRSNLAVGSGGGRFALITNEVGTVTIDRNTYVQPQTGAAPSIGLYAEGSILTAAGSRAPTFAVQSLTTTNNLLQANTYGVHSSDAPQGAASLAAMTKSYVWTNNTLGGKAGGAYPAGTTWLTALAYKALFNPDYTLLVPQADLGWSGPVTVTPPPPPAPSCTFTVTSAPPDASAGWTVSVTWTKAGTSVVCK